PMIWKPRHNARREHSRKRVLARDSALLAAVGLDHVLDLLLHRVQVEGRRVLRRRIVDGRPGQVRYFFVDHDEPPHFPAKEIIEVAKGTVRRRLPGERGEPLERILPDVVERRHIACELRAGPARWLEEELELEVIDAHGGELWSGEVPQFVPLRRSLARY